MTDLVAAVLLAGAATGLAAILANAGRAVYHDGLRPHVREIANGGTTRTALADEGWKMSTGFLAWYAFPTSLMSGVIVNHLLFLPADIIGIRIKRPALAAIAGTFTGVVVAGALLLAHEAAFDVVPALTIPAATLTDAVAFSVPLVPIVAALSVGGVRLAGFSAALAIVAAWASVTAGWNPIAPALLLSCAPLLWSIARSRPLDVDDLDFAAQTHRVRRSALPLCAFAGAAGGMAGLQVIASEPLVAWLLVSGYGVAAAAAAIVAALGFLPLVVTSAATSGVYSTQGIPDWQFAPGYATGSLPVGAVGAAALMLGEIVALDRLSLWVIRHPQSSAIGAAIRAAMDAVVSLALLVGGAMASFTAFDGAGFTLFAAGWLLNERTGRRVPAVGLGPLLAIGITAGASIMGAVN